MEKPRNEIAYTLLDKLSIRAVGFKREIRGKVQERQALAAAFWKELSDDGRLLKLESLAGGSPILGVSANFSKDGYDLSVCTETDAGPSEGMEVIEIEGGLYASFQCESATPEAVKRRWTEIYEKWFFRSGYGHRGTAEMEVYEKLGENEACELLAPVKKLEQKTPPRPSDRARDVFIMVVCALLFMFVGSAFNGASSVPLIFGVVGLFAGVAVNRYLKKRAEEKKKGKDGSEQPPKEPEE
ncbi:MAG TPA: effector binding domain-containing protein [Clostridia bacterium]|nr:effector binding domain-containing protein [Clostridia bacterium]